MKQATINHPALVALQGRLRTVTDEIRCIDGRNGNGPHASKAQREAQAAIVQIDEWLTRPGAAAITDAEYWLALPPVQWQPASAPDKLSDRETQEALCALDDLLEWAARARGYLAGIAHKESHARRVKRSNDFT